MRPARVLLAGRSGEELGRIAKSLSSNEALSVVGTVSSPDDARPAMEGLLPDVVVYLLLAHERPGAVEARLAHGPMPPILFVTESPSVDGWGDRSFLALPVDTRALTAAVLAVAAGLLVREPHVTGQIFAGTGGSGAASVAGRPAPPTETLTPREQEVLLMIADGLPNKVIAFELGISSHTVKFHISSLMQKLGASSRTEAVTLGLRRGIIFL